MEGRTTRPLQSTQLFSLCSAVALKTFKIVHIGHPSVIFDSDLTAMNAAMNVPVVALKAPLSGAISNFKGLTLGTGIQARSSVSRAAHAAARF